MAYTTKQASDALDKYLSVGEENKSIIENTKERGFVFELNSGEKIVIFTYPLVHKQDNTKNYFDTRDSGAYERNVAWKYSIKHNMKYFCVGVNDQVDKYTDYVFSLECDEKVIEKISGTKNGSRNGPGNQIIIPNDYIPSHKFERITNRLGIFISVIHKDSLLDYLEKYDNRPYMASNEMKNDEVENDYDEYQRAAQIIKDYIFENGFSFEESEDEIKQFYDEFRSRFSIEKLRSIPDSELLTKLFYSSDSTNDSLCYWLEFNQHSRLFGGGIAGGSAYKFGLFQRKEDGIWISGSPNKPEELSNEEAIEIGKIIRDALIKGAELIGASSLDIFSDYEKLDEELNREIGKYATMGWVHKYFCLLYPDKLSAYHSQDWQKHILYGLKVKPSGCYYGKSGQISMIRRNANLEYRHFFEAFYDKFGGIKKFCRLGTSDREVNYAEEWKKNGLIAIGWDSIGDLNEFVIGNDINRKAISESLQGLYYTDNPQLASRKAGELVTFFKSNPDTVFVAMDGDTLLALVDGIGPYYFDADKAMSHRKVGIWHYCFDSEETMPNRSAGHMTSCYELNDDENLLYLYDKYYYNLTDREEEGSIEEMAEFIPLVYNTSLITKYERNRIVFGAPGTGKSFTLKKDLKELLEGTQGTLERVTFHPDYTYSQFVGTYKPVSDANGDIRYKFVPGPFMRVYVDAVQSGRTDNPQPHLLLVEEINRAKVAAVFGDVFQLLDRDGDGVSEYEIQTTEDIRKYLADVLGGNLDNYKMIQIPNNMFIWATMNSADQGVYPMDTAFKRRWHFQYIGIDDSDDKVENYIIPVGLGDSQKNVYWNELRKSINEILTDECKINEDKLLGPFFLSKDLLKNAMNNQDSKDLFIKSFESKLIMYLFEDVMKMKPQMIFKGHANKSGKMIFSEICRAFEEYGEMIFDINLPEAKSNNAEE